MHALVIIISVLLGALTSVFAAGLVEFIRILADRERRERMRHRSVRENVSAVLH
jgi:hypothetical protein